MANTIRRYICRFTFCIPAVWFIIAIIFLRSDSPTKDSINEQITDNININKHIEMKTKLLETIKSVEKLIDDQSINESIVHVIHDNPQQVIAPIVDDKKINLNTPGEMGKGVEIDRSKLLPNDLRKYEDGLEKHAFNVYASDLISLHRSLPDVRDDGCRKIEYKPLLLTASIVICFYNEAWSVLLRSVHSIIDRSPAHLLKEIILVDDFSDMDHLKQPLDEYIKTLEKVRIIRQNQREGLVRSRLAGAATANGDVIIFLDSHIETTEGWLEPLLDPISQNHTIVIAPMIDNINDMTLKFSFNTASSISVGGFNWNLDFNWHPLSEREKKRRKHHLEPVRTPTMAGGLFAIYKQYFNDLGTYDDGLEIWGGENLEISFRVWMCGGTLLISPCSHVGHIFRKRTPYKALADGTLTRKNAIRVAEVWLDEYKKYYYERFNYDLGDYGDVVSRKLLRQKLECKSFKWYLTEIFPELFVPDQAIAAGAIRNMGVNFCVDAITNQINNHQPAICHICHNQGGNQHFLLSPNGEIRRDEACLDFSGGMQAADQDGKVIVFHCHGQKGNQMWIYNSDNQIYHPASGLCMTVAGEYFRLQMQKCDSNNTRHKWTWNQRLINNTNNA